MGPHIRKLVEYWYARCRNDCLPARGMIDPADLKPLLPTMFLVDCPTRDDRDWVYRLIGTEIAEREGFDKTGKPVRDYFTGSSWPLVRAEYAMCRDERRPVYRADTALHRLSRESFDFERIFLPLASDGHTVDMIVGVVEYVPVGRVDLRLIA